MDVNSTVKSFFNNRLAVGSGIAIAILAIFFISSSFTKNSNRALRAKQANLIIRQIGHRLLLQSGDSTSRVLPVTEIKEATFLLGFENEFVFNHDSLMVLSQGLLPKTQFPSGYTVTVHECKKASIVYGFQINNTSPDILACSGRSQPSGCYTIEIAFPDFYETTFNYPFISLVCSGMLLLVSVALLIGRFGKSLVPVPVQNQDHFVIKESAPEVSALGKFLFDVKDQRLLLGSEVINLTDKECKILELLNNNFGELISRETLMQKVWINEGVITGRSLDMFVSKLRKKLSADSELRITNVHGKGYKLEISGIQIL
jgi:hypothetical protein